MKKILFYLAIIFIMSCDKEDTDDGNNGDFFSYELDKSFLIDEKWFLESVTSKTPIDLNGDGNSSTNLLPQINDCEIDSYYQFERLQSNIVILVEGDNICSDSFERYGNRALEFEIKSDNKSIFFSAFTGQFLGGIESSINSLNNVEFLSSKDAKFKLLKSEVQIMLNGNVEILIYTLKANADNRP